MTKIDNDKVLRKRKIDEMTLELESLSPNIFKKYGFKNMQAFNAKIGSKHGQYIDIQNEVINSPEHFVSLYIDGMVKYINDKNLVGKGLNPYYEMQQLIANNEDMLEFVVLFLKRTYLRNFDALSKVRPKIEDAEMWIGQENASYGIMVTPRFFNGNWQNDKSEIRHFTKDYWTIGHILETGFLIPFKDSKIRFSNIEEYLNFFIHVLVRNSGSKHEMSIAEMYCQFVTMAIEPEKVPLLIPEFRYGGLEKQHKYRLDFTIINPYTMEKHGFELSPWSTHGYLSALKGKSQKDINEIARSNFEKEMQKHKDYYRKYNIFTYIYTDTDLVDIDRIFEEIKVYLSPEKIYTKLLIESIEKLQKFR